MKTNQCPHIIVSCILQELRGQTERASDEAYFELGTRKVNLQKIKHFRASMRA